MSNIANAFKDGTAFIGFVTAGDPNKEKSIQYILDMAESGCDLIEIGIPFTDPLAEGPVIQQANLRALESNINTDDVFDILEEVRKKSDVPLVFLTYINPVLAYGYEKFFSKCNDLEIDGIIAPDLPFEEKDEIDEIAKNHGIDVISLIAPSSKERIQMIASDATGFIYVVSSLGVTGIRNEIETDLEVIIDEIRNVTDIPTAVGFGISTPEQARDISKVSDGVIVGSAIVKIIGDYGENASEPLKKYVKEMKDACR
ncbi:tryptophan synthase subunit alpha [Methanobrevibacter sp. OttesenSCG-928-K11]|nr:tryptophan synthase subunit alpha [Methanobrevibacter sp. OttesenSCG-928-K11]MDL2270607.1 tryptophan synthase subunit alpha [Methanobrevibacter sp. OttesenSCG-928-I08]